MRRWSLFLPLIGVIGAAAVLGLSLGRKSVLTTESQVIERYAARYLSEHGPRARTTDCTARPAASAQLWLVIVCVSVSGGRYEYFVDHFGELAHRNAPEA